MFLEAHHARRNGKTRGRGRQRVNQRLGDIDWSSWPAWVVTLGPPAAGLAAGWLTSFKAARFKR